LAVVNGQVRAVANRKVRAVVNRKVQPELALALQPELALALALQPELDLALGYFLLPLEDSCPLVGDWLLGLIHGRLVAVQGPCRRYYSHRLAHWQVACLHLAQRRRLECLQMLAHCRHLAWRRHLAYRRRLAYLHLA
jgi:hypothetical protein